MKSFRLSLAVLAVTLCGCSDSTSTTGGSDVEPSDTSDSVTATCENVSFVLDSNVATGYACEVVPEADIQDHVFPGYVRITLDGYALPDVAESPEIVVYSTEDLYTVDGFEEIVWYLEAYLSDAPPRPQPFFHLWDREPWCEFPLPIGQFFSAHDTELSFENGTGVRNLTGFSCHEMSGPIDNETLTYFFEGMTDDGEYWVSAPLPISHPELPDRTSWPPEGYSEDEQDWEVYNQASEERSELIALIDAWVSGSFTPTIDVLDALIESITIH